MNQALCICTNKPQECARQNGDLIFYFVGDFSQNIIHAIGDAVKLRLEASETPGSTRRKLFSIFIEMAQNIIHYSSDPLEANDVSVGEIRAGSVCICRSGEQFQIICKNPVTRDWADQLQQTLSALREMSREEIKRSYRQQLRAEEPPANSKGAGLGLLTIARDSVAPIDYEIGEHPSGHMTLTLRAYL
ncbi:MULTISPECIES: SiaB family protein kinase [unclassified Ectothiorhodospira]|jgi:hypothetical protein|uniref:SiaB family protein kinase n=1 Tax=unclassified Ectothiorhodospira TaxID=2684909 RepID=UPI001EE8E7E3|nr:MULTISPECIES: SiaB family protein kinase [unclassified Ectothiorhodospira]MCG5516748.1 SiaB family protein kinase [Ectothiorhodospira sp. 9100]MCG5519188.1 SiaB family protein kinase [Ectothiorhodospira sp. 9905]